MSQVITDSEHDDLEAYALGALDVEDERRFTAHLASCGACRDGLAAYVSVTNALRAIPVGVPPSLPLVGEPAPTLARRRLGPAVFAYAAAAAVLLALGAGLHAFLQPSANRDLMTVAGMLADGPRQAVLSGTGIRGRVIIGRRSLRAAVVVRGLPAAPAGSVYHVWIAGGTPVLVGALEPAEDHVSVLISDAAKFAGKHDVEVSLESSSATAPGTPVATGAI